MLLLPIGFVKDAARAVKRICKEEFTEVKDSALTELLGIPTLVVNMFALRREGDPMRSFIFGVLTVEISPYVLDAEQYVIMCIKKKSDLFAIWIFGER